MKSIFKLFKKDLLTILRSNGTGLLKGTCRPVHFNSFEEDAVNFDEPIKIAFSLHEKNLGSFDFDAGCHDEKSVSGTISDEKVWLEITWNPAGTDCEYAEFTAILEESEHCLK